MWLATCGAHCSAFVHDCQRTSGFGSLLRSGSAQSTFCKYRNSSVLKASLGREAVATTPSRRSLVLTNYYCQHTLPLYQVARRSYSSYLILHWCRHRPSRGNLYSDPDKVDELSDEMERLTSSESAEKKLAIPEQTGKERFHPRQTGKDLLHPEETGKKLGLGLPDRSLLLP